MAKPRFGLFDGHSFDGWQGLTDQYWSIQNGTLWTTLDQDPMDPKSWTQVAEPILKRNDEAGVFGPGHHSFFKSPDGTEDWIAYHGKASSEYTYAGRSTRAQ